MRKMLICILVFFCLATSTTETISAPPPSGPQQVTVTNTPLPVTVTSAAASSAPVREALNFTINGNTLAVVTFTKPAIIEQVSGYCNTQVDINIVVSFPVTASVESTSGGGSVYTSSNQPNMFRTSENGILSATKVTIPTTPTTNQIVVSAASQQCSISLIYRYASQ